MAKLDESLNKLLLTHAKLHRLEFYEDEGEKGEACRFCEVLRSFDKFKRSFVVENRK